jgi:predicted DNA-binding transcriptional regulator AlpA
MTLDSPFTRLSEVVERVRLSRWTIARMVSEGLFPPPVRVSPGREYYRVSDVDQWIATRQADARRVSRVARARVSWRAAYSEPGATGAQPALGGAPLLKSDPTQAKAPPASLATSTKPSRVKVPPSVHDLMLRSDRLARCPRQAALAAARRRLFAPVTPPVRALSIAAARSDRPG